MCKFVYTAIYLDHKYGDIMKVLIVDDLAIMRKVLSHTLNDIGFSDIMEAADGGEALEVLKYNDIGLMLLDWLMPVMDGITLVRILRRNSRFQKLPIIMLTSMNDKKNVVEAMNANVDDYIIKPFIASTLKEKINKVLSGRQVEV